MSETSIMVINRDHQSGVVIVVMVLLYVEGERVIGMCSGKEERIIPC